MKYFVRVGESEHAVDLDGDTLALDGQSVRGRVEELDGTPVHLVTIGNEVHRVVVRRGVDRGAYELWLDGYRLSVEALDERARVIRDLSRKSATAAGTTKLTAPMPGLIVRVAVREGDDVRAGQGVVVMEAMKMENELRIASAGKVKRIHVDAGSTVERGALLLELE
jgi:acetyl/propionyl-CoA carboxylase alpha subunit